MRCQRLLVLSGLLASGVVAAPGWAQSGNRPSTPPQVVDPFSGEPVRAEKKQKIDLRPRFETGQVIRFRMELDQKSKSVIPALDDKPTESTARQELGLVFKVKQASTDGTTIELSFSQVKLTKKSDEGDESFDSSQPVAKDKNAPAAPSLRALAKTTLTLHLDTEGNLVNIEGGDELMSLDAFGASPDALPSGLPGLPGGSPGGPAGLGGGASAAMKQALGSIFTIKKGPGLVSVGEEWSNSSTLDSGLLGKFTISDKHKLNSHNGSEAKISVMGRIEGDSAGGNALSLVKISNSSFVGDYIWNTREGMLRRMNMHQHVVLESSAAGGITLTSDMKSVVTRSN